MIHKRVDDPQKVREYTKKIKSSGQHLLGLINDVLDMSKIEAGKTNLNLSDEKIPDIIDGVETIIRPQIQRKEHTFEVLIHDIQHENIVVDKLRLNQILLNLLSNACKYTPDGGHIVLSVTEFPHRRPQFANYRFTMKDTPGQYTAILMDVQMPVMNGLEATRAIRSSIHPFAVTIPIIAMTANAFSEDIRDCLEAGMNAHVSKPIDMMTFEQTVRRVLGLESGEKEKLLWTKTVIWKQE